MVWSDVELIDQDGLTSDSRDGCRRKVSGSLESLLVEQESAASESMASYSATDASRTRKWFADLSFFFDFLEEAHLCQSYQPPPGFLSPSMDQNHVR